MRKSKYCVTLLTDDSERVVVTRKRWTTLGPAQRYADGCAQSRKPQIETDYGDAVVDKAFGGLTRLRFTNNLTTADSLFLHAANRAKASIHAHSWDCDAIETALRLCPSGRFSPTTYVDGDERRAYTDAAREQAIQYGFPIHILYKGAYFDFRIDTGGGKLLVALGMTTELLRLMAVDCKR